MGPAGFASGSCPPPLPLPQPGSLSRSANKAAKQARPRLPSADVDEGTLRCVKEAAMGPVNGTGCLPSPLAGRRGGRGVLMPSWSSGAPGERSLLPLTSQNPLWLLGEGFLDRCPQLQKRDFPPQKRSAALWDNGLSSGKQVVKETIGATQEKGEAPERVLPSPVPRLIFSPSPFANAGL